MIPETAHMSAGLAVRFCPRLSGAGKRSHACAEREPRMPFLLSGTRKPPGCFFEHVLVLRRMMKPMGNLEQQYPRNL